MCTYWRRKWKLTPVFLPGESHGQRSLAGNGPQGRRESDMTEVTKHADMCVCVYIYMLPKDLKFLVLHIKSFKRLYIENNVSSIIPKLFKLIQYQFPVNI